MTDTTPDRNAASREGMVSLDSIPRKVVTVYIPLAIIVFVLLFPFYWMGITTFKTHQELYSNRGLSALWIYEPTIQNVKHLLFETEYPRWLWNTMFVTVTATFLSIFCSVCAAYAIERLRYKGARTVGMLIFLAYLVPPSILFIPL